MGNQVSLLHDEDDVMRNELNLSRKDIRIIRNSWAAIEDPKALGHQIFLKIFERHPQLKVPNFVKNVYLIQGLPGEL